MSTQCLVQIAIPSPLRRHFDYRVPVGMPVPLPGARVRVPFGRRVVVGFAIKQVDHSDLPPEKLKSILELIDKTPLLDTKLLALLHWAADYYHHPLGEVLQTALPVVLRQGRTALEKPLGAWQLTAQGAALNVADLKRAPRQQALISVLRAHPSGLATEAVNEQLPGSTAILRGLVKKGWLAWVEQVPARQPTPQEDVALTLNPDQEKAVSAIIAAQGFACLLLRGVTGSGKTEVYLNAVAQSLAQGKQVLVLVPEIGLTPQLVERFRRRFPVNLVVLHSGMNDTQRLQAWLQAHNGKAAIVLGTRSAVFTPMPKLGLIIVDEEHDLSYKQQDGFRYSARDVAIKRARDQQVAIVLGSATPSLESLHNARRGRYTWLDMNARTGTAQLPAVHLLDLRRLAVHDGLSPPLREAINTRLAKNEQSLLFLNRRGYAPVLMCHACGWLAPCQRCDARLTVHQHSRRLRCHHCGSEAPLPVQCPVCQSPNLHPLGEGTERLETAVQKIFPHARIERVDRDSTRRKGELENKLRRVHAGEADILVGTQMLAKGHDFPNLTLVGVVNADQGLFDVDMRAAEHLFQRIIQVAGRAGRADKPGEVLIQTYHPDNPVFAALRQHDYLGFADYALRERQEAQYPPFSYLALLRAESPKAGDALAFLKHAYRLAQDLVSAPGLQIYEPLASPMERRAGRYRAQLLIQADQRAVLHGLLQVWLVRLEDSPQAKKVRWSLDVDPVDMH